MRAVLNCASAASMQLIDIAYKPCCRQQQTVST